MLQGRGADVDVEDGNAMLMLKLQVFQNDDEKMIKLVRTSLMRGNSELMVRVWPLTIPILRLSCPRARVSFTHGGRLDSGS